MVIFKKPTDFDSELTKDTLRFVTFIADNTH